jgi:hypothetical protein
MSGNIIVQIYMYLVFSMRKLLEFKESGAHDHLPHLLPLPMLVSCDHGCQNRDSILNRWKGFVNRIIDLNRKS